MTMAALSIFTPRILAPPFFTHDWPPLWSAARFSIIRIEDERTMNRQNRRSARQGDGKRAAPAGLAGDADRSLMCFGGPLGNRQAQATAAAGARARFADSIKPLKDLRHGFGGYADSRIRDADSDRPGLRLEADRDRAAVGCVLNRVVEQV